MSSVVVDPATGANRSPSAQPLWVPRKWKPGKGPEEELLLELTIELEFRLELTIELELRLELRLELELRIELELLDLILLELPDLMLLELLLIAIDDGGSSALTELSWAELCWAEDTRAEDTSELDATLARVLTLATEELIASLLELEEGASGADARDDAALEEAFTEEGTRSLPGPALPPPPPHAVNTRVNDSTDKVLKV